MTAPKRARQAMLALAAALCSLAAAPGNVGASINQESIVMDDNELVYGSAESVETRMAEMKALGADTVRVSVFWRLVAPSPDSKDRPSFGAAARGEPGRLPGGPLGAL